MRCVIFFSVLAALSLPARADPLAALAIDEVEKPERVAAYRQERLEHAQAVAEFRRRQADFARRVAETRARSADVAAALVRNSEEQERYRQRLAASQASLAEYQRAREAYERCLAGDVSACPTGPVAAR